VQLPRATDVGAVDQSTGRKATDDRDAFQARCASHMEGLNRRRRA